LHLVQASVPAECDQTKRDLASDPGSAGRGDLYTAVIRADEQTSYAARPEGLIRLPLKAAMGSVGKRLKA